MTNLLHDLPDLVVAAEETVAALGALSPDKVVARVLGYNHRDTENTEKNSLCDLCASVVNLSALREARTRTLDPGDPTVDELASEAGATKALVNKALKKLLADGRIDKLDGRSARYVSTGGEA